MWKHIQDHSCFNVLGMHFKGQNPSYVILFQIHYPPSQNLSYLQPLYSCSQIRSFYPSVRLFFLLQVFLHKNFSFLGFFFFSIRPRNGIFYNLELKLELYNILSSTKTLIPLGVLIIKGICVCMHVYMCLIYVFPRSYICIME